MKTLKLLLAILISGTGMKAQVLIKLFDDRIQAYYYTGGDEFNATGLNETKWINGLGGRRVLMSQDLAFSPKMTKLDSGLVIFTADRIDSTYRLWDWEVDSNVLKKEKLVLSDNRFTTKFSVGGIKSREKFHYGYYELRFKVEEGKGVWPAFWFFGGVKNEEIDVMELKGEKNNKIHVDTHCPYGCDRGYKNKLGFSTNWEAWLPVSEYLHDGFNIISLDWQPDEVIWYINGYPLAYFKGDFPNPMNIFINTSVAKDGGPFKPGPDEKTTWPNRYFVDYLRIWRNTESSETLLLRKNDSLPAVNNPNASYALKPTKRRGLTYSREKLNDINGTISITRSSDNKLSVTVLGKLAEGKSEVTIKTSPGNKTFSVNPGQKESVIVIEPSETEMELEITYDGRKYAQKIRFR